MARNYDENYLDGLIAKAKKSWEGVDVERYMSDLRDDSFVHQIQQALRLCGLNDLANNFKV